jgi:rubrerythrin
VIYSMQTITINCESCGQESTVTADDEPQFCPICGEPVSTVVITGGVE